MTVIPPSNTGSSPISLTVDQLRQALGTQRPEPTPSKPRMLEWFMAGISALAMAAAGFGAYKDLEGQVATQAQKMVDIERRLNVVETHVITSVRADVEKLKEDSATIKTNIAVICSKVGADCDKD